MVARALSAEQGRGSLKLQLASSLRTSTRTRSRWRNRCAERERERESFYSRGKLYMLTCMQTCTACRLCQLLDGRAQHVAVLTARHVFPDPLLCTSSTDKMVCSPSVRTLERHRKMATMRRAQRHLTPRIHCLVCNPLGPNVCTGSLGERRLPAVAVNVV